MRGLDIRTALTVTGLVGFILFLCLAYVYRTRQTYPGFGLWTLASLFMFLGTGLQAFRGIWPDSVTVVAGNSLNVANVALHTAGLRAFLGKSVARWLPWAGGLSAGLVSYYFGLFAPHLTYRIVMLSVMVAVLYGYCSYLVFAELPQRRHSPNLWLTVNFGLLAAWFVVRCFLTAVYDRPDNTNLLSASFVQGITLLVQTAGNITITLGLLILNLARTEEDMQAAVAEVRTLRGIIPICSNCKKIRDDRGAWNQLEVYISAHSGAEFSHGYCPDCLRKVMATLDR